MVKTPKTRHYKPTARAGDDRSRGKCRPTKRRRKPIAPRMPSRKLPLKRQSRRQRPAVSSLGSGRISRRREPARATIRRRQAAPKAPQTASEEPETGPADVGDVQPSVSTYGRGANSDTTSANETPKPTPAAPPPAAAVWLVDACSRSDRRRDRARRSGRAAICRPAWRAGRPTRQRRISVACNPRSAA